MTQIRAMLLDAAAAAASTAFATGRLRLLGRSLAWVAGSAD